ncbi:serine/threonine-protein kinase [Prosthecobacter sp.]|uniref:serine/threonine-protein kinase n=1 Tax=Prosthecobacter sp. TaxID=1965333 RepID=UPI0037841C8B
MPDSPDAKPKKISPLAALKNRAIAKPAEMAQPMLADTIPVAPPAPGPRRIDNDTPAPSRDWVPPSVEILQQTLPQYEVSQFIARGGMGAVYQGIQRTLKRPVAIKVLPREAEVRDLQFSERFKHEAEAMARLSHPNIVPVYDAGETEGGLLYFVMEFVEGTDVAHLIASEGLLEPQRAIDIIVAVCEALAFAHEEGIIHRDIKPSNIMIDKRGRVKVADFGLAKSVHKDTTLHTGTHMAMGTPDFIAPEAWIPGMKIDQRADLYAVGVMLYQMLTGKIPRGRFMLPSSLLPQVDRRFDAIVDKAMQTDRELRYNSAIEIKTDVEKVRVEQSRVPDKRSGSPRAAPAPAAAKESMAPVARRETPKDRERGTARRPRLFSTITVMGIACIGLGIGVFMAFHRGGFHLGGASAQSPAAPERPLPQAPPAHVWKRVFQDWEDPDGWIQGTQVLQVGAGLTDCAIRCELRPGSREWPLLTVRDTPENGGYYLVALPDKNSGGVLLTSRGIQWIQFENQQRRTLSSYPKTRVNFDPPCRLELWAVGKRITTVWNGKVVDAIEDATLTEGAIKLSPNNVVLRNVEVLVSEGDAEELVNTLKLD